MKKMIMFLLIFFIGIFSVNALEIECKYKVTYGDNSDNIIFYLDTEKGLQNKFKVEGTGSTGEFKGSLGGSTGDGTIFGDKQLYFDTYDTMQKAFVGADGKPLISCPNTLNAMGFGMARAGAFNENGYYFVNVNYWRDDLLLNTDPSKIEYIKTNTDTGEDGEKCYCCGSSSRGCTYYWTNKPGSECALTNKPKEECTGTTADDEKKVPKNCGVSFVFSAYGRDDASNTEGYSIMGQYYTQNGQKYIILTLKKGTEEIDSHTHLLPSGAGEVVDIDYFATFGARTIRVESFDKCENVGDTETCDVDLGTGGKILYVGQDCSNDENADTDTKHDNETKDEYEKNYANKHPGASHKDPSLTGFGSKGDKCDKVLGTTLASLVKEAIKWVRIAGGIIAIVNGMLKLIPAIMSKDAEALSKAARTCVIMAIILVFCALFPWLLNLIGSIFKWDVSCIV